MQSTISQFTCFSSTANHRRFQLHTRSYTGPTNFVPARCLHLQVLNVTNSGGQETPGKEVYNMDNMTTPTYIKDASASNNGNTAKLHFVAENFSAGRLTNGHMQDQVVSQPKRATMIDDSRFAIWFGALALSTGLLGFIFSRNPVSVGISVIFCSALLVLNIFSLMIWKQGKSSLPFLMVQAVLFMALLWKNFQAYSLSQKTGFNLVIRMWNMVSPFRRYFKSYRFDHIYLLIFFYLASICINAAILCFVVKSVEGWRQSSA